jgi:hypothetical protein
MHVRHVTRALRTSESHVQDGACERSRANVPHDARQQPWPKREAASGGAA